MSIETTLTLGLAAVLFLTLIVLRLLLLGVVRLVRVLAGERTRDHLGAGFRRAQGVLAGSARSAGEIIRDVLIPLIVYLVGLAARRIQTLSFLVAGFARAFSLLAWRHLRAFSVLALRWLRAFSVLAGGRLRRSSRVAGQNLLAFSVASGRRLRIGSAAVAREVGGLSILAGRRLGNLSVRGLQNLPTIFAWALKSIRVLGVLIVVYVWAFSILIAQHTRTSSLAAMRWTRRAMTGAARGVSKGWSREVSPYLERSGAVLWDLHRNGDDSPNWDLDATSSILAGPWHATSFERGTRRTASRQRRPSGGRPRARTGTRRTNRAA